MATNILALGEDVARCAISTGEDWLDGLRFSFGGAPVPLDGIGFRLQVRKSASGRQVYLDASTDNGLLQILPSTLLVPPVAPGPGHAPGDVLPLAGGVAAVPAAVTVDTVDANGRVLTFHVSTPGSYSVAPASFAAGSGAGALTFGSSGWGVAAAAVTDPGIYPALPASPLAQASTSGLGVGAAFADAALRRPRHPGAGRVAPAGAGGRRLRLCHPGQGRRRYRHGPLRPLHGLGGHRAMTFGPVSAKGARE